MFDRIAGRYDLLNRLISFGLDGRWRRATVAALGLDAETPARVLDLATGTGDVALEVLRQFPKAEVVGVDPSPGMLAIGREKAASAGVALDFLEGSAEALPFEDDAFDGLTIAFGIRNVADRMAGLAEMARVTRPGGRIVLLEGSEPERGLLALGARFYMHQVVPRLGAWLSGEQEYRYLPESIAAFPPPEEFARHMEAAGLEVLEVRPLTFGVCHLYVGTPAGGAR
jgi:demethylmenaquinone methyltransferase/2-methoxy-6-polyprenyl-1,4-benzoquinol methylase